LKFIENAHSDEKNGRVCGTWNTNNQTSQYRSIRYIGAPDLETSALALNTRTRFYSDEELFFEGTVLRLPSQLTFSSYAHTGRDSWTIYRNTNGKGPAECLEPNIDPYGDYGVTFSTNKTLVIGAIARGCGPNNDAVTSRGDEDNEVIRGTKPTKKPNKPDEDKKSGGISSHKLSNFVVPLSSTGFILMRMQDKNLEFS
jgi:hypothetical protein